MVVIDKLIVEASKSTIVWWDQEKLSQIFDVKEIKLREEILNLKT